MKKITLLIGMICNCLVSYAQFTYPAVSSNQQLIQEAVEGGIYMIRQSYQLKETRSGNLYGRGGKNEFGTSYTVGVKTPEGFYLVDKAVRPWEYDIHYDQYRGENYSPVVSSTQYVTVASDSAYYRTLATDGNMQTQIPETIYQVKSKEPDTTGFLTSPRVGKSSGWIVWVAVKNNAALSKNPETSYHIYRKELNASDERIISIEPPQIQQQLIGGIYLVPEQTRIGQITFRLQGILVEKNKAWALAFPFQKEDAAAVATPETPEREAEAGSELTPVSVKKDTKKDKDKKKK